MNNLYDVLEICLQDIEAGADMETVLFRYPDLADDLRPILETSMQAKNIAVPGPAPEVVRRNRAKLLQQAAQMRESKVQTSRRLWSVPLRRALVSMAVIAALFMSGTGLVGAASSTLPGDRLYPVKRTWEDVLLALTFNIQAREALEIEHENERLEELYEIFAEGRSAQVDFAGLVTHQNGGLWLVSKIPVVISAQTDLPAQTVVIDNAVRVIGVTQNDGTVLAGRVELLPAGMPLPEVDDDDTPELEQEKPEDADDDNEDSSGNGSEGEAPEVKNTQTPDAESDSDNEKISMDGAVDSINGDILIINGQPMDIGNAEIKGTPKVGASVKVEGYYDVNGVFIVMKIEFGSSDSNSGSSTDSEDNTGDEDGNNDNGNDDSSGSNDSGGSNDDNDNNENNDDNSSDDNNNDDNSNDNSGGDD